MYKKIPVTRLTGNEQFKSTGLKKFSVLDFWQYGFSSLNSNVLRGALAEFIVENALKESTKEEVRSPWGDYDVLYDGKKIEVKCSSYIQDWDQTDYSIVKWSGLKAKGLYYSEAVQKLSEISTAIDYKADVYVLALFKHQDHATLDILDMNQWCFFVLTRDRLKEVSGDRVSISLARLQKHGIGPVGFNEISSALQGVESL